MTINDLPAIMGTVLIIAGLALVGIYTRFRTEGSEKERSGRGSFDCGRCSPLGAVVIRTPRKIGLRSAPIQIRTLPVIARHRQMLA
jgi:hypothetical protein